ncbi:MAG: hypothetical protein AB8G86_01825 [Saprospiraceae bacterium]
MLLLLAFPIATYSVFLGIVTVLTAIRLWWENAKSLNEYWQETLNRRDSLKYGRFVQQKEKHLHQLDLPFSSVSPAPKPFFTKKQKPKPKAPKKVSLVEQALDNLDPKLRNLGEKK